MTQSDELKTKPKMVGWYNPTRLMRTGVEVIVSSLFAFHADNRRIDALAAHAAHDSGIYDYRNPEYLAPDGSFWFDYVADCGDGWHSTYAVARALSFPSIPAGEGTLLHRGRLLIFGGDLVYPTPSAENYTRRLVEPYAEALLQPPTHPREVLALPGNHDWYDSLVAFGRLFKTGRPFATFKTRQTRSYFAAQFPGKWWLFGLDLQLGHDIDEVQFKFFIDLSAGLAAEDKVILCYPESVWISKMKHPRLKSAATALITTLENHIGHKLRISLAGDLHHYRRFSTPDQKHHRITCGTGGAYLHPTHDLTIKEDESFSWQKSFPSESESWWLTFLNFCFLWRNPKFGLVTAGAYLLVAWQNGINLGEQFSEVRVEEVGRLGLSRLPDAVVAGIHSALLSPLGTVLYFVIFFGFVFFSDRTSKWFRSVGGTIHAMAHIVAGFFIFWLAAYASITWMGFKAKSIEQYLSAGAIILSLGYLIGPAIFALYLLVSCNCFGKHTNEAFSSLKVQDWKGFLRGRIKPDGVLDLYFIGLRRIPGDWRDWKAADPQTSGSKWDPKDAKAGVPEVVDRISSA